ncbi:methyltransferase [Halobacteriales archaeon QS_4_69_34]|nr:MAG: methyltransferase [Halobacteriales archaeon QS_4_69_34]
MGLDERRAGDVYEPAEDSHLLATAAIERVSPADSVLDVGTGSGYVAATVREEHGARVLGSDPNPHACRRAREHGVPTVRADLLAPFRAETFDAVLFNPPYLPTSPADAREDWMALALSGGKTGRAVIEPFLDGVGRVLAPGGVALLLVSSLAGLDEVTARAERNGFVHEIVATDSFPFEVLSVLELVRKP